MTRCAWVNGDPLLIDYHDNEWGVPLHDDQALFEFLTLEGAQAGLSWSTILKKREGYRAAFDGFNPQRVAGYGEDKMTELLGNAAIVRTRAKIRSAVNNAGAFLRVQKEFATFNDYIWQFTAGAPIRSRWKVSAEVPARSSQSDAMSKGLANRGFTFVGTTICYAFMQATGMVNDHLDSCFRHSA